MTSFVHKITPLIHFCISWMRPTDTESEKTPSNAKNKNRKFAVTAFQKFTESSDLISVTKAEDATMYLKSNIFETVAG